MTEQVFPLAGLVAAPRATAAAGVRILELARMVADAGAAPVIVAAPPDVALEGLRVVRTRPQGTEIAAIRLGMAQLTNTVARAVLLVPVDAASTTLTSLLALVDAAKRAEGAMVALEGATLDRSPLVVPRDAWLELVTLGESGMDAVAARRRLVRVDAAPS